MADLPPGPDDDIGDDSTPRWVKVFGIIAIVLVVLFVIVQLTGEHGPGRHMPSIEQLDGGTPSGDAGDHRPPGGGHG